MRYTTCGHKAKDITRSIAWRREALKEEALDDLPWKDERGPSSIRRTVEPFWKMTVGKLQRDGSGAHRGFSERIDTILNLTGRQRRGYCGMERNEKERDVGVGVGGGWRERDGCWRAGEQWGEGRGGGGTEWEWGKRGGERGCERVCAGGGAGGDYTDT